MFSLAVYWCTVITPDGFWDRIGCCFPWARCFFVLMHLLVCSISDSLLHVWRTDGTNINIHAFCVPFCSEGCSSLCSALLTLYVFLLDALPFSSGHEQRHIWLIQLDIVRRQLSVFALLTMLSSCLRITRTKRQQWHSFFDSLWLVNMSARGWSAWNRKREGVGRHDKGKKTTWGYI